MRLESKYVLIALCAALCTGCTYSVVLTHTEGQASDVVDGEQSANPDISPEFSIPAI